jgi:hypothetical protein
MVTQYKMFHNERKCNTFTELAGLFPEMVYGRVKQPQQ